MSKTTYHELQDDPGSIETYTGTRFTPMRPDPDKISIRDIAHSLSMNCRYNGHCSKFYSVAEHSVWLSKFAGYKFPGYSNFDFQVKMWCLLHDASEAYIPDMPRPIKGLVDGFDEAEEKIQEAVAERFDLEYPIPGIVHKLDNRILADEVPQLMRSQGEVDYWHFPEEGRLGIILQNWEPKEAYMYFMDQYLQLKGE